MKRTASPQLLARASCYSSSVTLFDLPQSALGQSPSPRRSKRVKTEASEVSCKEEELEPVISPKKTPLRRAAVKTTSKTTSKSPSPRKVKRQGPSSKSLSPRKIKVIKQVLAVPHPEPERWREQYDAIKAMRAKKGAPVDTMGCDLAKYKETEPKVGLLSLFP